MPARLAVTLAYANQNDTSTGACRYAEEYGLPISPRIARYLGAQDVLEAAGNLTSGAYTAILADVLRAVLADPTEVGGTDALVLLSLSSGFEVGGLQDTLLRHAIAAKTNMGAGAANA